ncbi:hypothetical protein ACFWDA_18295 [Rhodococcus zopfii]|uniref:hypothetical protein n=1 Tax=Rhodococcus zopfii TaxID=43772 RepID=UPI0009324E3A|nr:hypothetical protein [Rhodococcus zopfii]
MPVWGWILIGVLAAIAVVAVVAAVVAARAARGRTRTEHLKERFGPEYERTVGEVGEQRAAENELAAREKKREALDIVSLSPEARDKYQESWRTVQTAFIDDPSSAVGAADRLVTDVMRQRGYPVDDFDRRAADISVDHPTVVDNYRAAHGVYLTQQNGTVRTEDQREAFVHYRTLFESLLARENDQDNPKEARA